MTGMAWLLRRLALESAHSPAQADCTGALDHADWQADPGDGTQQNGQNHIVERLTDASGGHGRSRMGPSHARPSAASALTKLGNHPASAAANATPMVPW